MLVWKIVIERPNPGISNAIDSVNASGSSDRTLIIRSRLSKEEVVVDVEDTGICISDPSRIFEAFFTTKEKRHGHRPCNLPVDHRRTRRTWLRSRCRQSRRRRCSLQLFASSLSQHCAPAVSSCAIASKCKWLDECGLNLLIDVATLHEDVIPFFQTAQYHQSSEFDRAITDMNISDSEASISASKLGWTSC